MKVLTGIGYTQYELSEISNKANSMEIIMNPQYANYQWLGSPTQNNITGAWGLVIDEVERERWLGFLTQEHKDRLVDVVDGDGWVSTIQDQ